MSFKRWLEQHDTLAQVTKPKLYYPNKLGVTIKRSGGSKFVEFKSVGELISYLNLFIRDDHVARYSKDGFTTEDGTIYQIAGITMPQVWQQMHSQRYVA